LEIEIEFRGGNGQFGEERFRSRFWDPILADAILNFRNAAGSGLFPTYYCPTQFRRM
jgi:hypothetical protein